MYTTEMLRKKRKKKKRRWIIWLLLIVIIAAGAGTYYYHQKQLAESEEDANSESAVVLEDNQSWLYLEIVSILGNEIEAREVDPNENRMMRQQSGDDEEEAETETYQIPVGTDVVTSLGSVTTFSRLAAGDVLHCLMENTGDEDVILKIWIGE